MDAGLDRRSVLWIPLTVALASVLAAGDSVKLSGPMALGEVGDVTRFELTSDGSRIVYRADQEQDEVFELWSAPVDGSAAPIRLTQEPPLGADVQSKQQPDYARAISHCQETAGPLSHGKMTLCPGRTLTRSPSAGRAA